MDPEAKRPTCAKANTAIIPRIPQDIIDEILDHLAADPVELTSLRSCSLVSKSWILPCQQRLFYAVTFTSEDMERWLNTFPVPEESPALHVRDLSVWIGGSSRVTEDFFGHTVLFTNVKKMTIFGQGGMPPIRPTFWKLPRSITTFTFRASGVTLVKIRDIMAQLPNLDDLSLFGSPILVDRSALLGIGTALGGRFGGQLALNGGWVDKDVINMLLEVPTRLHFTEVHICATRGCLPPAVRLAGACSKTIVKLSYWVILHGKSHPCLSD